MYNTKLTTMLVENEPDGIFENSTTEEVMQKPEIEIVAEAFSNDILYFAKHKYPHLTLQVNTEVLLDVASKTFESYYLSKSELRRLISEYIEAYKRMDTQKMSFIKRAAKLERRLTEKFRESAFKNEEETLNIAVIEVLITGDNELLVEDLFNRLGSGDTVNQEEGAITDSHMAKMINEVTFIPNENGSISGAALYEIVIPLTEVDD